METATAATESSRRDLQSRTHHGCYACRATEAGGLGLNFTTLPDGSVTTSWPCPSSYQSYDGILHGGIVATLLDGAMVHALFARGVVARTGELLIRYRQSVKINSAITVTARLGDANPPLYHLEAELHQMGALCASAKAKFMETPAS